MFLTTFSSRFSKTLSHSGKIKKPEESEMNCPKKIWQRLSYILWAWQLIKLVSQTA